MEKKPLKMIDRKYVIFATRIMGELIYLIAIPVVLLAFFGKWLDTKLETAPIFLIGGFVIAAIISGFAVWRRAKELGVEYQELENK